ncbi:hypothetical protein [Deinococcus sonorensis]|uniref:Uncharacterized protein n=2 Tax=Deinococcus sonorensis TaxID=309891 RepID=A0AAU7UDD1_9DEIO
MTTLTRLSMCTAASLTLALGAVQAQSTAPAVTSLTLINTATNQPVTGFDPIQPGANLDLAKLPAGLNIRANTSGQVGSVRFAVDGNANYRTENAAPYSLCVDDDGKYRSCPTSLFTLGEHRITASASSQTEGRGTQGAGVIVSFTVTRTATTTAPKPAPTPAPANLAVTSLTLMDADTDRPVAGFDPIPAGATLRLSALPRHLNLRANTSGAVRSVSFVLDRTTFKPENDPPFALCSDTRFKNGQKGDYLTCGANIFTPGDHTLRTTPYSKMFAAGQTGAYLEWNFKVVR